MAIIEQQQNLIVRVLTPLLDGNSRLTAVEQVALKAALQMTLCNPALAVEFAVALQLLTDAQQRADQKREDSNGTK